MGRSKGRRERERNKRQRKQVVKQVTSCFSDWEVGRRVFCSLKGKKNRENYCLIPNLTLLKEVAVSCNLEPTCYHCLRVKIFDVFLGKENKWANAPDPLLVVVCCGWDVGRTSDELSGICKVAVLRCNKTAKGPPGLGAKSHHCKSWGWRQPTTWSEWRLATVLRVVSSGIEANLQGRIRNTDHTRG